MEGITPDYWIEHQAECHELLKKNWDKIPVLSSSNSLAHVEGKIVKFRGMIQDMMNPLLYFTKVEALNVNTNQKEIVYGKYKECAFFDNYEEIDVDNDLMVDQERRPYFCVSTPGLNDWAVPYEEPISIEDCIPSSRGTTDMDTGGESTSSPSTQPKRCSEQEESLESDVINIKRQRTTAADADKKDDVNSYFPIPSKHNQACVVTLYDVEDGVVKLNEIIEAIGFLWYSSVDGSELEGDDEDTSPSLPPLVPRLHAVAFRKIKSSNPFYSTDLDHSAVLSEASSLRADLHLSLSQLMLGDSLAADYLICNLVSTVYVRQDFLALGKLCVNFSYIPRRESGFTEGFYSIIQSLVPKSHYLPFSLEAMNSLNLLPQKDYEKNRLKTGVLQLSDNTHLVLDETKMQEGRLQAKGVENVKALNDLITYQRLIYDFKYHMMEFPTDIPVIILSEGKSLLKSDVEVVVEPSEGCCGSSDESLRAVRQFLREPLLNKLRQFISVASSSPFEIPHDLLKEVIEKDYVELRKDAELKTTVDDLHNLLVLARLLSLSHGKNKMCEEMWKKAVSMETERKLRISRKNR